MGVKIGDVNPSKEAMTLLDEVINKADKAETLQDIRDALENGTFLDSINAINKEAINEALRLINLAIEAGGHDL